MKQEFAGYKALIILGRRKLYSKKTYYTAKEALKEAERMEFKLIKLPIPKKQKLFGKIKYITTGYRGLY